MPDLSEILNNVPELSQATPGQRQEVLDQVYEGIKSSGKISSGKLRQFRQDRMSAFLKDESGGQPPQEEDLMANYFGGGPYRPEVKDFQTYYKLQKQNTLDDLRDVGRVVSDPRQIAAGIKKMGQDLLGLGLSAWAASGGMSAAGLKLIDKRTGKEYIPTFAESVNNFNNIDTIKKSNEWYNKVIKDDPELAKVYHTVVTDAILGAVFGIGRAAKAGKTGLSMLREFFAPLTSNVVGGQIVFAGMEGVDKTLDSVDLPDEVKTGARIGSMLAFGIASGMGPEKWIENVVAGNPKAVRIATQLGQVADAAKRSGIDFKTALAQNPDLSDEAKQFLGVIDEIDPTTGQILNSTAIQDKAGQIADAIDSMATGKELTADNAALAKSLNPTIPLSPMKPEDIATNLGSISTQPKAVDAAIAGVEQLPQSAIPVARQALESLDMLISADRATQGYLKQAIKNGDINASATLAEQAKTIKEQISDAQRLIALEVGEGKDLVKLVNKDIRAANKQLKSLRNELEIADVETRKALLEEKASALEERINRLKDRKSVFKEFGQKPEAPAPIATPESAEKVFSELSEADRLKVEKVSQAAQIGTEDILGRPLSDEERLNVLSNVLNNKRTWSANPFTPSALPTTIAADGSTQVLAGYVGEKYPMAGQVLSVLHPQVAKTGTYTPDQVLQLAQSLTSRAGLGMDAASWDLTKDVLEQSYKLWDDVRGSLPKAPGANLQEFVARAMPGSKPTTVKKVSDTINRAFPELDLSFSADALPKGVAATADSLTRMVTVGLNKVELKDLMHEIGHLNFWHGLDADMRFSWMESARANAIDEASWARAFPEYAERQDANASLDAVARAKSEFWMQNPSEMYAQQFSAYTIANVIPKVETLGTFQRAWRGLKNTMGIATERWDALSPDTKQMLVKTLTSPDPVEARLIPSATIDEGLKGSRFYATKDIAEPKVTEMRMLFESTYGQQFIEQGGFFNLPMEQRVAAYTLEDLPKAGEMQALSILHDLPGGNWDELKGIIERLHKTLDVNNRSYLIESMIAGKVPDLGEYSRLDEAARGMIAADKASKNKREWVRRLNEAEQSLKADKDAGRIDSYTPEDVNKLAEQLGDVVGADASNAFDQLYTQIEKQLAVMDETVDSLKDFTNYVLVSKGLVQAIEPSFSQRLSRAELYSQIARNDKQWRWPSYMWKAGLQSAYIGLTGLEYDPNGSYLPFLGTVRWSPERFLDTAPLGVFLLPGGWQGAKFLGKQAGKITKPAVSKAIGKLPFSTRLKLNSMTKTLHRAFAAGGGLSADLTQKMREATIFGQLKKQDFYAFAETMHRHFTPEERANIAKIYEQRPGIDDIIFDAAENRPDIMAAVEMTRKLYSGIPDSFKQLGLWSKNFEDLEGHYINRVYDGVGKKPTNAIFLDYNIAPIRADFLKRRGLEAVIKNGKSSEVGASSIDAMTQLRRNAQEAGVEIREGLKLNSWEAQDGTILYSIPGTDYDNALRAQKLAPMHQWDNTGTGYVLTEVRNNSYKVRRDFTVKEREGMGEVVDVAVRSAAMGEQLERDLRQGRAFYNIANSSYAKRVDDAMEAEKLIEQGWTLVEDSLNKQTGLKKYGALSGMYIHPDAKDALAMLSGESKIARVLKSTEFGSAALKAHKFLLNGWKVFKTILTPVAHANNFVSNLFMGHIAGHNSISDLTVGLKMSRLRNMEIRAKKLSKDGKFREANDLLDKLKQDEYYQYFAEMRDARMADSSLWANELNSRSLLEELKKANMQDSKSNLGDLQRVLYAGYGSISGAYNKATQVAGNWYEKGDLIYKMGAFANARRQGRSVNDSVKYAYEAYFDYGNLSPVAKTLRDSGMVPFVSYIYNVVPALAKGITERPERVAGIALLLEALHLASVGAVYGPDDLIAKREAVDAATPEYMQRRGLGGLFRTKILNPFGTKLSNQTNQGDLARHQFLDISRMIPGGDLYETGGGVSNIDFSLSTPGELLFALFNQSPLISVATTMATGKNPQLGYYLTDGGNIDTAATRERKDEAVKDLLINTFLPNLPFIPGTPTYKAITDAIKANTGIEWGDTSGLDAMGMPKSLGVAVSGVFGLKFRDVYPEVTAEKQINYLEGQLMKEEGRLSKIFQNPAYTEEYRQRELEKFKQSVQEVEERQIKRANLLQRLSDARRARQGGQTLPR